MLTLDLVVPVGRDDEALRLVDAPAEHVQGVERRLVRPVDVLEDDDRGLGELGQERARDRARIGSGDEQVGERAVGLSGDVRERPERRRRREVLARPAQDAQPGLRAECPHERRLPDAGLAAHEHEPSALRGGRSERGQQLGPLEKRRHLLMFRSPATGFKAGWPERVRRAYHPRMAVAATERTELVERGASLELLREACAGARERRGSLVFIGGEAGVGKTALVRRFADELGGAASVLWGGCDPLLTPPPLGPILEIAAHAPSVVSEAIDGGGAHAIATALLAAGDRRMSLVIVLEDVHWADEATLDVLRVLGRRVGGSPTLVIATYRDDELERFHPLRIVLGELATADGVKRMALELLSPEGVSQLAQGHGPDVGELYRLTSGNPFYVTEVLASGGTEIPSTVRDVVLARIAGLSASASAVVEAAAIAPPSLDAELTLAVCGDASESVDECLASGVLVAANGGVAFRHELARAAVEDTLSPTRRLALHRAVLLALTETARGSVDLARIAYHAEAAADTDAVLWYAPLAAEEATRLGAHREAAAQYGRALRFAGGLPPGEQATLLERRSDALYLTDDQVAAIADLEGAMEQYRRAGAIDREAAARGRLVPYLTCRGLLTEAEEAATGSIAALEALPESPLLADATGAMALTLRLPWRRRGRGRVGEANGGARAPVRRHREARRRLDRARDRRAVPHGRRSAARADARRGAREPASPAGRSCDAQPRARVGRARLPRASGAVDRRGARPLRRPRARPLAPRPPVPSRPVRARPRRLDGCDGDRRADRRRDTRLPGAAAAGVARARARACPAR